MCRNSLPVLPRNRQTTVAKDRLRVSPVAQDPSARCSGPWPLPELREALPVNRDLSVDCLGLSLGQPPGASRVTYREET